MVPGRAAEVVLLVALLATARPDAAVSQPAPEAQEQVVGLLPAEIEVMELVNEFRAGHGLPPHRVNGALCRASRGHAANMARQERLSHVLDGQGPGERALGEGFPGPVAENCAAGDQGTPRAFFDLWIASEAHRRNLLGPEAGEMGVGVARTGKEGKAYCAAMFSASR